MEFVLGVIVGVVLTYIGEFIAHLLRNKAQKDLIKNFCIDTVNNIKSIVEDMDAHRHKTNFIHQDYLFLLDIEFNVFGRNREHLTHLPSPLRENVRKFVNGCAVRRAEIGYYQTQFNNLSVQLQTQVQPQQAQEVRNQQHAWFGKAVQALDQLVNRVKDGPSLVDSLKAVR